jgi:endonuclease YncB( thermonuclease family)
METHLKFIGRSEIQIESELQDTMHQKKNQYGGSQATNKLIAVLIGGKTVTINPKGMSYNRVVADVSVNRKNLAKRLKR